MSECIAWWGSIDSKGYGTISRHSKNIKAHRYIYSECFGPIPDGREVHHECENKACVNPEHLRAVTRSEHVAVHESLPKAWASSLSVRAARETCRHGHPWTPENTRVTKRQRVCKTCEARDQRAYLARKRARVAVA